jgi:type III secretion protein V
LQEVTMARGEALPGGGFTFEPAERLASLGIAAQAAAHPDGTAGAWIAADDLPAAAAAGITSLAAEEVIAGHLLLLVRRYGHELLGIQEVQGLLEGLERTHPALVREVVPKLVSPVLLADVLRRLAEEGISVRGLREILGTLAAWAPAERDPMALTEHVRAGLRRQITAKYAGPSGALSVHLLDPMIEVTIRESVHKTPTGSTLALEPALCRDILAAVGKTIAKGRQEVILTGADVRPHVRRLVETAHPHVAVLSYQELVPEVELQPLGRIQV